MQAHCCEMQGAKCVALTMQHSAHPFSNTQYIIAAFIAQTWGSTPKNECMKVCTRKAEGAQQQRHVKGYVCISVQAALPA
eukprot:1141087-Pelagomonas_calceolata.AAC.6